MASTCAAAGMVNASAFTWPDLPVYSSGEADLVSLFRRSIPGTSDWRPWVAEVFSSLLECPNGTDLQLTRTASVPGQPDDKSYAFAKDPVSLGRDPENDVVLAPRSVGRRHARIVLEGSCYFLEDLGTPLGTYVNKRKMAPNERVTLASGDQFSIFPYRFTFTAKARWMRETNASVTAAEVKPVRWSDVAQSASSGHAGFTVAIHPLGHEAYLETSRSFLEEILRRLLHKFNPDAAVLALTPCDVSVFEYLISSTLERANRDIKLPLQLALGALNRRPSFAADTRGLELRFSIGLSGTSGAFRLFLPYSAIAAIGATYTAVGAVPFHADFRCPLTAGSAELSIGELSALEVGDIILFEPEPELLLPGAGHRGWKTVADDDNLTRFRLDNYFERRTLAVDDPRAETADTPQIPDLGALPVRLHVVLGEKELPYTEASRLVCGAIVELNRDKDATVSLWINGKRTGEGRLVQIEGRLGVQVIAWSQS